MPSPDVVSRALTLIGKHAGNHNYFFSKLDTPDWIEPLAEAGLFVLLFSSLGPTCWNPSAITHRFEPLR